MIIVSKNKRRIRIKSRLALHASISIFTICFILQMALVLITTLLLSSSSIYFKHMTFLDLLNPLFREYELAVFTVNTTCLKVDRK